MRKKIKFIFLILFFININYYTLFAYDSNLVKFRIESYDKTILNTKINADTFSKAIKEVALKNNDINIIFDLQNSDIYSINGIENNIFTKYDRWLACILRGDEIIDIKKNFNINLKRGDTVLLYYGDMNKTNIISDIETHKEGNNLVITTKRNYEKWVEIKNKNWVPENITEYVKGAMLRIILPNNEIKILKTNDKGEATLPLSIPGIYEYNVETYAEEKTPNFVKTDDLYYFAGVDNVDKVTRGEAAFFITQVFKIDTNNVNKGKNFKDIDENYKYYKEIQKLFDIGAIHGYDNKTFKPNSPITLLELTIMLSNLSQDKTFDYNFLNAPDWAKEKVGRVISNGYLNDINIDLNSNVSVDIINKICDNIKEK